MLKSYIYWNWPITFVRDTYVVMQISCLYNLGYFSMENKTAETNSVLAATLFVLLVAYPLLL